MDENDIDPRDIPWARNRGHFEPDNLDSIRGSKRYFRVKGFAWYRQHKPPTGCSRTWASAHSWCVIDLRQQRIIHKYGQDCRTCGGKSTPSFNEEARRRMAEYVCQRYLYRTGQLEWTRDSQPDMTDLSGERDGPHDQSRCDMCKMLGHSCRSRARDTQSHYYSSSSESSQSPPQPPPIVVYRPAVPPQPCTICGSTDHSYWSCTSRRSEQVRVSSISKVQVATESGRSYPRPRRPAPPRPVIHCTTCGSTDHSHRSCTSRRPEQVRASNTNQVQVATASGSSNARPGGLAGVRAAFARLGALLFGRRQWSRCTTVCYGWTRTSKVCGWTSFSVYSIVCVHVYLVILQKLLWTPSPYHSVYLYCNARILIQLRDYNYGHGPYRTT